MIDNEFTKDSNASLLTFGLGMCISLFFVTRLFNYGIGIHLIQTPDPQALLPKKEVINPKDNHISFQVRRKYCNRKHVFVFIMLNKCDQKDYTRK